MLLVVLEPSFGPGVVSRGIQTLLSILQVSGEGEIWMLSIFFVALVLFWQKKMMPCICLNIYLHTHMYSHIFIGEITAITVYTGSWKS